MFSGACVVFFVLLCGGVVCFLFVSCVVCLLCVCVFCVCFVFVLCLFFVQQQAARHSCHMTPAVACMGLLQGIAKQPAKRRDPRIAWQSEQSRMAVLAVFVLFVLTLAALLRV